MNTSATLKAPATTECHETGRRLPTSRLERAIPFLVFFFCFAYLFIPLGYSSLEPDEGIVLQGAERVLHGQVPYRDFFTFYTPGSFYLLASFFRLFGDSFMVARLTLAVAGAVCSVLTYLLARRVCSRGVSIFAAGLATMVGVGFRFLVLHNWYSTLLACLAVYAGVRYVESNKSMLAFASALFTSLTLLVEQSKGVGLCLGLALGLLLLQIGNRKPWLNKAAVVSIAIGFAAPLIITFAYFGQHGSISEMVQSWLWPLRHYTQANHVPYGFQNWSDASRTAIFHDGPLWVRVVKILAVSPDFVIPVLPLISVGLLVYFIVQLRQSENMPREAEYYILICSAISGLLLSVVIARADILHFIYLAPLLYVVLAWILDSPDIKSRVLSYARPYLIAYVAVAFGLLGLALLSTATGNRNEIKTRRGVIKTGSEDTVLEYVQTRVPPGGVLLVYPYLPLYNYLTATMSPSRLDYFQPGMNTPSQASEIVASLKSHPVPILFEPWFAEKISNSWPGTPSGVIADDPVADYIVRNYSVCRILSSSNGWRFEYMAEKSCN